MTLVTKGEEQPLQTRNANLFQALRQFCLKAILLAQAKVAQGMPLFLDREAKWVQTEYDRNTYRKEASTRPDMALMFFQIRDELLNLSEYKQAEAEIKKDSIWTTHMDTLVGTHMASTRLQPDGVVFGIAARSLGKDGSIEPDEQRIDAEIERMNSAFQANTVEYIRVTPLRGVELTQRIDLTDAISIQPLSNERLEEILNKGMVVPNFMDMLGDVISNAPSVALVSRYCLPKILGGGEDGPDKLKTVEQISEMIGQIANQEAQALDILSLILDSPIFSQGTLTKSEGLPSGSYSMQRLNGENGWHLGRKVMSDALREQFLKYWSLIAVNEKHRHALKIAVRRYSGAMARSSLDDRLIDLMICAESLYFNEDSEQSELTNRLAYRAALFLGETPDDKRKIFGFMKHAYSKRSKVVHGKFHTTNRNEAAQLEELNKQLSDYLRQTILKMFEMVNAQNSNKALVDWTALMFGDEPSPSIH